MNAEASATGNFFYSIIKKLDLEMQFHIGL